MFDVKLKEHWLTSEARSQGIDEHILELLLRHSRTQGTNLHREIARTLSDAIIGSIYWHDTPEGYEFWKELSLGYRVRPKISNSVASITAHVWYIDFKEFE